MNRDRGEFQQAPAAENPGRFSPGGKVWVDFGRAPVEATVLEDRGNIGAHGRRIIRVAIEREEGSLIELEVPVDELAPPPADAVEPPPSSSGGDARGAVR